VRASDVGEEMTPKKLTPLEVEIIVTSKQLDDIRDKIATLKTQERVTRERLYGLMDKQSKGCIEP